MDWLAAPDAYLARWLLLRLLAVTYLVAFATFITQGRALLGARGLLPVADHVARTPWRRSPSLFHLASGDRVLLGAAWAGAALAAAAVVGLPQAAPLPVSMLAWAVLWALHLSIVNVGQRWYSFGWETLLAEVGFLAIFLGSDHVAPPLLIVLGMRWILFRVELGAGLIKIRGDRCWRDLTCLHYHHETQPMPNPLSWWFHHLPGWAHRVEVAANHVVQLGLPWLLFAPQPVAGVAAVAVIVTQAWLLASGNFSWLNFLTLTLAVTALPGAWLGWLPATAPDPLDHSTWFQVVVVAVAALIVALSYAPVRNLLSSSQAMNASFHALRLVNTYGAFGSVTKERRELIVEGAVVADGDDPDEAGWRAYEFRGKPGDPARRPPQVAPYHLRLDWLMWFVALSPGYGNPWLGRFLRRLLEADGPTLRLLRCDPFGGTPPTHVRVRIERYRFTTRAERRETGHWWHRDPEGLLVPPVTLTDIAVTR